MTASQVVADRLAKWFEGVRKELEGTLFAVAPEGPHREAAVYELLSHHARLLRDAPVDSKGALYNSLVLELAAACRVLGVTLGADRWAAAVENVDDVEKSVSEAPNHLGPLGLSIGTRAQVFKQLFAEALADAGVVGVPTVLNEENRRLALGLSVNWGMRLLLAYAVECHPHAKPGARHKMDLTWIASQLGSGT
jgi:hypothetical protein